MIKISRIQGYLYCVSILMVYMLYGTYATITNGCWDEIESTANVGDYFGVVKNGCVCNPWVAFTGNPIRW